MSFLKGFTKNKPAKDHAGDLMILNTNVQVNNYFSQQDQKKENKTQKYAQTQVSSRGKSKLA